ncbi:hypothetical protein [Lyticum sinuosum]|nr:hypothetical protein [Lyticum sinuosum]
MIFVYRNIIIGIISTIIFSSCSSNNTIDKHPNTEKSNDISIYKFCFNVNDIEVYDTTEDNTTEDENLIKNNIKNWISNKFVSYGAIGKLKIIIEKADINEKIINKNSHQIQSSISIKLILETPKSKFAQQDSISIDDSEDLKLKDEDLVHGEIRGIINNDHNTNHYSNGNIIKNINKDTKLEELEDIKNTENKSLTSIVIDTNTNTDFYNINDPYVVQNEKINNIEVSINNLEKEIKNSLSRSPLWMEYTQFKYNK